MTTTKAKRFNKDGIEIEDVGPLKDGERRSFPMSMMDSALVQQMEDKFAPADTSLVRHSRGFVGVATPVVDTTEFSNAAEASYAERKQRLSQAWLYQQPKPATPPLKKDEAPVVDGLPPVDDRAKATQADVDAAIAVRNVRLEKAWAGAA